MAGEDGVEPGLQAERQVQVQAQRNNEAGVTHEAKDACKCPGMVTDCLFVPTGQESDKQIEELLASGNGPAEGESSGAYVEAQIVGQATDLLGPFVEGELAGRRSFAGTPKIR